MGFHINQKLVCVEPFSCLRRDRIYICQTVGIDHGDEMVGVDCCAEHSHDGEAQWFAKRFRPLTEQKSSVSFTMGAPLDSEHWDGRKGKVRA